MAAKPLPVDSVMLSEGYLEPVCGEHRAHFPARIPSSH